MRCPRKLYLVVSRKCKEALSVDVFPTRKKAVVERDWRNKMGRAHRASWREDEDWRIQVYVKGN